MSKKSNPSLVAVAVHAFLVLITGGLWLVPLILRWFIQYRSGVKPSLLVVAGHCILGLITGGFWLVILVIYYLLKK